MSWNVRGTWIALVPLSYCLAACGDDVSLVAPPKTPAVRSVLASPSSATLRIGESLVMVATVDADSGADKSVTWTSADPRRVSITANGIVTAVSEGIAVVSATSKARPELVSTATMQVLPAPAVRGISLVPGAVTMRVGETLPLLANVVADSGADRALIWNAMDPSRATVSATGVVTAVAEGTGVITATSRAQPHISGSAVVTIVPAAGVKSISVTPNVLELTVAQQAPLAVTVQADDGVPRTVTFTSQQPTIATVSPAGVVTGVAAGTATITVAAAADTRVTTTALVTVRAPTPPTVSIQSVTQGSTGIPVSLTSVAGQIEVTINVASGQDPLASVELVVGQGGRDTVVASQLFNTTRVANVPPIANSGRPAISRAARGASMHGATAHSPTAHSATPQSAAPHSAAPHGAPAHVAPNESVAGVGVPVGPITLSFRSDAFDATTGAVAFRNGAATLRAVARASSTSGPGLSASNSVSITLRNTDGFVAAMRGAASTATPSATDANGLTWVQAGNGLVVTTIPVMYSGSTVTVRVIAFPGHAPVATFQSAKAGIAVDTVPLPNYSAPSSGPLYVSGELPAVSAVDQNGNQLVLVGTAGTAGAGLVNATVQPVGGTRLAGVRVDNAPPPPGATFVISSATPAQNSNNWVNGSYQFASGLSGIVGDPGVGLPGSNTTPTAATAQAIFRVAGGTLTDTTVVQKGSDLPAVNSNLTYTAEARYGDRLGNTRAVPLTAAAPVNPLASFGVDLQAPTARYATVAPAGQALIALGSSSIATSLLSGGVAPLQFGIEANDDRAGFGAAPALVTLTRLAQPNPPGATTGTTTCVVGVVQASVCTPAALALAAVLPDGYRQVTTPLDGGTGVEGYYTYTAVVRDQAGNESTPITNKTLYDVGTGASAPQLGTIGSPAFLRGGQAVPFTPLATDNVELKSGRLYLQYPNLPITPILAYEGGGTGATSAFTLGTLFDAELSSPISGGAGFTVASFIRALEITDSLARPQPYAAATVKPTGVNAVVHDGPDLVPATLAANVPILAGQVESPSGAPGFAALTGIKALVQWRRFAGGNSPLRFEAVGPSGQTESPFARVILVKLVAGVAPNAQVWRVVSETTTATGSDNGLERVWRYDLGSQPSGSYIAIGVSAAGDAIASLVAVI